MPATRPRQVLPVDAALALAVGALAYGSTRWVAWSDEPSRREGITMRHGGPPFRVPDSRASRPPPGRCRGWSAWASR